jgi:uncharacterized membrane protein
MGSVILIVPMLVFSVWLLSTTGRRVFLKNRERAQLSRFALVVLIGLAIGAWFTFGVSYKMGATLRLRSFPVPTMFIYLQDSKWVESPLPPVMKGMVVATDFLFGVAFAFFPFKVMEFIRQLKTEL